MTCKIVVPGSLEALLTCLPEVDFDEYPGGSGRLLAAFDLGGRPLLSSRTHFGCVCSIVLCIDQRGQDSGLTMLVRVVMNTVHYP